MDTKLEGLLKLTSFLKVNYLYWHHVSCPGMGPTYLRQCHWLQKAPLGRTTKHPQFSLIAHLFREGNVLFLKYPYQRSYLQKQHLLGGVTAFIQHSIHGS